MGLLSKNNAPPPPNYQPLADASLEAAKVNAKTSADQLDWARQQDTLNRATSDKVINQALDISKTNATNAASDRAYYEQTFRPQEQALAADATSYASPERKQLEIGAAQADVGQQFDAARNNAIQHLEGYGANPGSVSMAGLDVGVRAQEAASKAAAGYMAGKNVENTARALRGQAIALGQNDLATVGNEYGTAMSSGNQAVNAGLSTTSTGANTMGTGTQWGGLANQGYGTSADIMNTGYKNALDAAKFNQSSSSGIGSLIGAGLGAAANIYSGGAAGAISSLFTPTDPTKNSAKSAFAEGGQVPDGASPTQGRAIDDVPAQLTAGEFVMPKDAVSWLGEKSLQKMIEKTRQERQEATAKPRQAQAIPHPATFVSRPSQALPVR